MKWLFIKSQLALILMAGALTCRAAGPYYVAPTGVDDGSHGGSWALPYATISNGVAHATTAGDVVNVSNGVYVLTTNITISTAMILRGQDRTNTIIQGQYPAITNRGLYVSSSGATMEEFTVRGFGLITAADRSGNGGGVYLEYGTLRNCIITTNIGYYGGGIYNNEGMVSNCVISSNTCYVTGDWAGGGGIFLLHGSAWNCTIIDNDSPHAYGGGAYILMTDVSKPAIVANSTISNNTSSGSGAGCYMQSPTTAFGVISNCTVANNWIPAGSVWGAGIGGRGASKVYSCIIRNNSSPYAGGGLSSRS